MGQDGSSSFAPHPVILGNRRVYRCITCLNIHGLTGFQRDLVYVISGNEDPHGLALKNDLDDDYEKEIHHGRLSPNLDTLVEKGQRDRRTNYYALTRRGQREIEARDEWGAQYLSR